jgi:5-methylcytosine-specific restriction endonuclease McrA
MAEYCSQCNLLGDYDIDLHKLALKLKRGHSINFLCEGCNNRAIYKDEEGRLYLGKTEKGEIKLHPVNFDEL